jgi:hypothetical protein
VKLIYYKFNWWKTKFKSLIEKIEIKLKDLFVKYAFKVLLMPLTLG